MYRQGVAMAIQLSVSPYLSPRISTGHLWSERQPLTPCVRREEGGGRGEKGGGREKEEVKRRGRRGGGGGRKTG